MAQHRGRRFRIVMAASGAAIAIHFVPLRSAPITPTTQQDVPAAVTTGVREAAWSPDGKRIAATWFDAIWTMTPDGKDPKRLVTTTQGWAAERDPAWSPDGKQIAFSASINGEFDEWVAPASGGAARRVTTSAGDERWPSWTKDGHSLLFSHRNPKGAWTLLMTSADPGAKSEAVQIGDGAGWQGTISPDGKRVAFVSDRGAEPNNDADIWTIDLTPASNGILAPPVRLTSSPGAESHPTWAPSGTRIAYAATRNGVAGVWVSGTTGATGTTGTAGRAAAPGRGRAAGGSAATGAADVLASRHLGVPAWSPDGQSLLISTFVVSNPGYNGNPNRNDNDPPTVLAGANEYALWRVLAPREVDEGAATVVPVASDAARWTSAFDQVWQTLKSLYYTTGPSASAWDAVRDKYRPQMAQVKDLAGAESIIDRMVSEEPPMKPALPPSRAMVTSGHPLASAAGAAMLERGGNIVDAGIATAFALGVVEPEATGVGGDGQAILFLKGMTEPVVIEYKDMTPSRIAPDNARLFTPTGGRTAPDGPTVANIPGTVAGLDLLYQKYGSKKISWSDLIAPAVKLADEGFVLDESLPTSIEEGKDAFAKYPEAAKIYLPGGHVPKPGDRFVNKDYAETLRTIAKDGADAFYRGSIARRIADDMAANGGVIALEDLAQYRAMERKPIMGMFRGHRVYSVPAPVSTGAQLVETLQILDNYTPRPGATIATDADYLHYAIEAWRVRDGGGRIADPERWPVDYGNHFDPAHTLERFKLIDPAKVYSGGGRGGLLTTTPGLDVTEDESRHVQTGTTSFAVADGEGNMIVFTQTLSTWGGNYYVSKGLGFLYNDHFRGGGGRGGGFGSTLPLMRSSSTSVPTLLFAPNHDGLTSTVPGFVPKMAVGAAGNAWIPASVYNVILNVIDGGLSAQRAIEGPRILIGGGAGGRSSVQIEDRIPREILADLEARGHSFTKVGRKGEVKYGYASVVVVDLAKHTVDAGAEPRRSHGAAAAK